MIIRIWNNDGNEYCDYEAETIEEIRDMCKERIQLPTWKNGYSKIIEEKQKDNKMTLDELIQKEYGNSVTKDTLSLIKVDDTTYLQTLGLSDEDKKKIVEQEIKRINNLATLYNIIKNIGIDKVVVFPRVMGSLTVYCVQRIIYNEK